MIVESNYYNTIAIAFPGDRPTSLAPFFQPMRSTMKTNRTLYARFSRSLSKLRVNALFAPVVIGRIITLVLVFRQSLENRWIIREITGIKKRRTNQSTTSNARKR